MRAMSPEAYIVGAAWFVAVIVGTTAGQRREIGGAGGFLGSLLLSWLGVFLIVMLSPVKRSRWMCPHCREEVKKDARICKHCGARFG